MLERLNVNLFLNFAEGRKGTRAVRVLTGGVMTMGDAPLPVRPYGDHDDDGDGQSPGAGDGIAGVLPVADDDNETSSHSVEQREDVSLCKVHRGDRIRTCDLLTPSQAR